MPQPDRTTVLDGEALRTAAEAIPGWVLGDGRIRRRFEFADFSAAFAFMTRVALLAERLDHHPDWSNVWNRVDIELTNHDAGGITEIDIHMAAGVDVLAGT